MSQKNHPAHYLMYDWLAPLYDLGVWLAALFLGGEEGLRGPVLRELEAGSGAARERRADMARPLEGRRVLEIFAGTATLSIGAASLGAKAVAVDVTAGMLRVASEKAHRAGAVVEFIRADAESLPFPDGSFDGVVVSLGLHETEGPLIPLIIKEAARVLRGGGRFVIFDFHRARGGAGFLQALFFAFFEGETAGAWVRTDIQKALMDAGFASFKRAFLKRGVFQLISVQKP
ncbi:MAG: methyltransferase domain-containing protein [Deltaproteobacteria bacterium]|nr:methyltransferase domain-containing protein [Deltaproteobacteria bacterium]